MDAAYTSVIADERLSQAKSDLLAILPAWPRLTLSGFWERGIMRERSEKRDIEAAFRQGRAALLSPVALRAFVAARAWLRVNAIKQETFDCASAHSYSLKHLVEEDIGYLANGTMIAAALAEGFTIRQCTRAHGAEINCRIALGLTPACIERLFPPSRPPGRGGLLRAG